MEASLSRDDIFAILAGIKPIIDQAISEELAAQHKRWAKAKRRVAAAAKQAESPQPATHSRYVRDCAEALSARLDAIEQGPLSREQVCALAADEVMAERQAGNRAYFSKQLCDRIASEARSDPASLSRYQKRHAVIASKNPRH